MTIAVPERGVYLGSLIDELALLLLPGLGSQSPLHDGAAYERHRAAIAKMVRTAAKAVIQ
jgi:hypothetical protein